MRNFQENPDTAQYLNLRKLNQNFKEVEFVIDFFIYSPYLLKSPLKRLRSGHEVNDSRSPILVYKNRKNILNNRKTRFLETMGEGN
jgi:hypothetical protein